MNTVEYTIIDRTGGFHYFSATVERSTMLAVRERALLFDAVEIRVATAGYGGPLFDYLDRWLPNTKIVGVRA